ncbi:hypothetical protein GCM10017044_16450 [Kordiimonas sediminis]|uniref:TonB C-terminal domain-containing protein n=1 Tax=Kordiimonas sediminis TaxID=1735581 RepID=A0A919ATZ2_9PROT|nr:TonB family protein [Kordiimonas sediminis]GHF22791.1 hypothetical protein GCM10017044_16450 [Kordiimonas sediminis]
MRPTRHNGKTLARILRATLATVIAMLPTTGTWAQEGDPHDALYQVEICRNPSMPYSAKRKMIGGTAVISFDIDASGRTENIQVLETSTDSTEEMPYLAEAFGLAGVRAIRHWQYFAYFEDGVEAPRKDVKATFLFQNPADTLSMSNDRMHECLLSFLPEPPSTAGDPMDPFNSLKVCTIPNLSTEQDTPDLREIVELQYSITADGDTVNVTSLSGPEQLQQKAVKYLQQWKYNAFIKAGTPAARNDLKVQFYFGQPPEGISPHNCAFAAEGSSSKLFDLKWRRSVLND